MTTLLLGLFLALGALVDERALPGEVALESAPLDQSVEPETAEELAPPPPRSSTKGQPGIRKLDPKTRARVMSALAGLVILWLAIMVFIWLGARYTRRYMRGTPRSSVLHSPVEDDDWARKKLVPEPEEEG